MKFIVLCQDSDDGVPSSDTTLDRQFDNLDEALDDLSVEYPETEVDRYQEVCDHEEGCSEDVYLGYSPETLTVYWDTSREACIERWAP